MAVNTAQTRVNFINALMDLSKLAAEYASAYDALKGLFDGAGLSGTFVDGDFANDTRKHLDASAVGTFYTNHGTVRTAISVAILNNFQACAGAPTK